MRKTACPFCGKYIAPTDTTALDGIRRPWHATCLTEFERSNAAYRAQVQQDRQDTLDLIKIQAQSQSDR